jgi:hypothetical protein
MVAEAHPSSLKVVLLGEGAFLLASLHCTAAASTQLVARGTCAQVAWARLPSYQSTVRGLSKRGSEPRSRQLSTRSASWLVMCRSSLAYGILLAKSAFTPFSRSTTATPTL